jgi:hypothetical protein
VTATREGLAQRGSITEIAEHLFDLYRPEITRIASWTGYHTDIHTAVEQRAHHRGADESRCSGDEGFHDEYVTREM